MNVRTSEAPNYNLVGLRTNLEETHVVGVLGDGMVFYPWDWCLAGTFLCHLDLIRMADIG